MHSYRISSTLQVSVVEEQRQESAKSDDENKANDEEHSSEPSNGKTDINDTPMDESQVIGSFTCGAIINLQ
jgi:hypothetical protein